MRRSLGGDPGCGDTPGSGEGLQGGNPWDSRGQAEYLVWKRLCRPVLHNTGREGKAEGGKMRKGPRKTHARKRHTIGETGKNSPNLSANTNNVQKKNFDKGEDPKKTLNAKNKN